jgi:hypothetical protein
VIIMPRSTKDVLSHAEELAQRFENYEPGPEDERDPVVLQALRAAVVNRSAAERVLIDCVAMARKDGLSWVAIGAEVGTSGEAARQRYSSLIA